LLSRDFHTGADGRGGIPKNLEPMDLHAWFEAHVGRRWYTFDPTSDDLQGARVVIAYRRDAADVDIYTLFGDPAGLFATNVMFNRLR